MDSQCSYIPDFNNLRAVRAAFRKVGPRTVLLLVFAVPCTEIPVPLTMQPLHQDGATMAGRGPVSVNPACSVALRTSTNVSGDESHVGVCQNASSGSKRDRLQLTAAIS